jgi:hypothetical protein
MIALVRACLSCSLSLVTAGFWRAGGRVKGRVAPA